MNYLQWWFNRFLWKLICERENSTCQKQFLLLFSEYLKGISCQDFFLLPNLSIQNFCNKGLTDKDKSPHTRTHKKYPYLRNCRWIITKIEFRWKCLSTPYIPWWHENIEHNQMDQQHLIWAGAYRTPAWSRCRKEFHFGKSWVLWRRRRQEKWLHSLMKGKENVLIMICFNPTHTYTTWSHISQKSQLCVLLLLDISWAFYVIYIKLLFKLKSASE